MRTHFVVAILLAASVAAADVPDSVLRVVKGKDATLVLKDTTELVGHVDDFDA